MIQRPCKKCRAPLMLVKGENGKDIPLDMRAPVYEVRTDLVGVSPLAMRVKESFYVSHFSTCPHANDFSKKGGRS